MGVQWVSTDSARVPGHGRGRWEHAEGKNAPQNTPPASFLPHAPREEALSRLLPMFWGGRQARRGAGRWAGCC